VGPSAWVATNEINKIKHQKMLLSVLSVVCSPFIFLLLWFLATFTTYEVFLLLRVLATFTTYEAKMVGRNILHIDGDKATIHIDVFKTRVRTNKKGEKQEFLPRYVKELNPRLTSLLKDYIKKWNITDMSKVKDKAEHYLFHKETGKTTDSYDENGFSKYITSCMKQIFKKTGLSVNTMRHVFQDFIGRNITLYNEHQLEEIATDVGDKYLATMYRYRAAPIENRDKNVTEIEGDVYAFNDAAIKFLNDAEEEGSVGEGSIVVFQPFYHLFYCGDLVIPILPIVFIWYCKVAARSELFVPYFVRNMNAIYFNRIRV
jgi:hypothetical protein